jgi:hypothetical protein
MSLRTLSESVFSHTRTFKSTKELPDGNLRGTQKSSGSKSDRRTLVGVICVFQQERRAYTEADSREAEF